MSAVTAFDAGGNPLTDPLPNPDGSVDKVTEIRWQSADALPFPLCLSSIADKSHGSKPLTDVSIALGNIVPADHGRTIMGENLGTVSEPTEYLAADASGSRCTPADPVAVPGRYRPLLQQSPLTLAGPLLIDTDPVTKHKSLDPSLSATAAMLWTVAAAQPAISLQETLGVQKIPWVPQPDLLESSVVANDFVVETEFDGSARLRFGDDVNGRRPTSGAQFSADYRVGNGTAGNVGAHALFHVLPLDGRITGITNPLPAIGGAEMESADQIRRRAPQAYQTQERCVTAQDYQDRADIYPGVQRSVATFRWTGSWHTVFVTVDPIGGGQPSTSLDSGLAQYLELYRMAGYDLQLEAPQYISLEIGLLICVAEDYFRSDVEAALLGRLGSRALPDGSLGLFYPDNFSFGQTVYLSPIYAAARGVEGVASVQITKFQRQGLDDSQYLVRGKMTLGRLEIARLDSDPNFPENGILHLQMCGGQ